MTSIDWTDELRVGVESIDDQHRNLLETINKFEEARRRGKDSRIVNLILNDILGYTQEHFSHEEAMLKDSDFPGWKSHQDQHRQLLQDIERFQYDFANNGGLEKEQKDESSFSWLTDHILECDKEYSGFLQAVKT